MIRNIVPWCVGGWDQPSNIGLLQYFGGSPHAAREVIEFSLWPTFMWFLKLGVWVKTFAHYLHFLHWCVLHSVRAGILASYNIFGEAPTTRDILRVFLHVAHSCGSSGCEHGCRPSYTSCICCVGVWEQQYWPIGGSPDQGNYLKAYSHTVWYSHRQGFEKESFGL